MTPEVQAAFARLGVGPRLVSSKTWYAETFSNSGDWDGWVWKTVLEKPYGVRLHHFEGFVVFSSLGKANANVVSLALANHRPVFHYNGKDIKRVKAVTQVSDSWKDGWIPVAA